MARQSYLTKREEEIDILKGIGIILMIIAHTCGPYNLLWDAINSFHMPLFFIVSGYLYKQKEIRELFSKSFSRLIIPYLTACLIIVFFNQIRLPHKLSIDFNHILFGLGPGWFLLAMFFAKLEFHYILHFFQNKHYYFSLITSASICLYVNYTNSISILSIYPSLASLVYFSVGLYIRQNKILEKVIKNKQIYLLFAFLWLITLLYGKIVFSYCYFRLNIIDFIGSISGVFFFYIFSKYAKNANIIIIKWPLQFVGKYSIIFLFYHTIDNCVYYWYLLEPYIHQRIILIGVITTLRILITFICVYISTRSRILRIFFHIK